MKGKLVVKGLISFSILAASVLVFIVGINYLQSIYENKLQQQIHSTKVIALAQRIQLDCTEVILCGFAQRITRTQTERGPRKHADLIDAHKQLCGELESEPNAERKQRQVKLVHEIKVLCDAATRDANQLNGASPAADSEGMEELTALVGTLKTFNKLRLIIERLGEDIIELTAPYQNIQTNAEKELAGLRRAIDVFTLAGTISVCCAFGAFVWFMRGVYGSVRVLLQNTKRLAQSQTLLPFEKHVDDELGQLDLQFREMATALETANRRRRATIDHAGDIICVLDRDMSILEVNPAATQLLGWTAAELKNLGLNELIVKSDQEKLRVNLEKAMQSQSKTDFDCQMKTAGGAILYCEWTVQWSPTEQEMFCVIHDFSDRKRIEQMKKDFFDMISHDMRTPLSSVALAVQAVTDSEVYELPGGARRLLNKAESNAIILIRMVNDLLDMDKFETGKMELSHSTFSLKAVCDEAMNVVSPLAENKEIRLIGAQTDLDVLADTDRILRVIVNLLANAIKFSPIKGTITLHIERKNDQAEVSVTDQGRGIPAEMIDAVFDRFTQVRVGDATKKGGTGLGLAICKAFVELHGGQIGVDSEVDKGSRFWFRIPIGPIPDKKDESTEQAVSNTGWPAF